MKDKLKDTTLLKLWRLLPRHLKRRFVLVAGLLLVSALANVGGIASIMPFMQVLADPSVVKENEVFLQIYQFFGSPELSLFLLIIGAGVLGVFVLGNLAMALSIYAQQMFVQSTAYWFTSRLMRGYLEQPYEFFLNRNGAELSKNVFSEVGQVTSGVMIPAMEAAARGTIAFIILAFLIIIDPATAFIAMAVLGGGYILIFRVVKQRLSLLGKRRVEANSQRFRLAAEAFGGIKQVKLSGRENDYMDRFNPYAAAFERTKAKTLVISKLPKFALEVLALGGILTIALLLFALEGTVAGVLPILSLYAVAGYRLMPALQILFQSLSKIRSAGASVDVLYTDMRNLSVEIEKPQVYSDSRSVSFAHSITLKNISFTYPNTALSVIDNLSLELEKNTTVGFVGPTGCGKTTLIDIILGLLHPCAGEYLVDGRQLDADSLRVWQRSLGYVPQDIFLSDDTVTRNVAFGVPEAQIDPAAVQQACDIANIDEFIRSELSEGYETVVGERGIRLSGGQRQRIGIARALYHDPQVLILDEATSALDGRTESAIMDAIHTLAHKKTIIMIAHRLTTLRDCDTIYVLEQGKIVDSGRYHELKERNEAFRIG